jgi:dihydrofolate reductase
MPVFVLTHHERDPLTLSDTTFTFVTDGIESALKQARAAATGKDDRWRRRRHQPVPGGRAR